MANALGLALVVSAFGLTFGLEVASIVASIDVMPVLETAGRVVPVGMVAFVGVMPVELSVLVSR